MTNWMDDLADYLDNLITTDIFFETFDMLDADCIALVSQGGAGVTRYTGGIVLYNAVMRINIKHPDMESAKSIAQEIYEKLGFVVNTAHGFTWFKRIEAQGEPYHVSTDDTNGTIYSINFDIQYNKI